MTHFTRRCLCTSLENGENNVFILRVTMMINLSEKYLGRLGGSAGWASNFSSAHDLLVCEFQPHVRHPVDSSEPEACFRFCVSSSLCPSHAHALSHNNKINAKKKKFFLSVLGVPEWLSLLNIQLLISAQVMILRFLSLSPASGSVLTAQTLEPASDSVSPPLSAPPPTCACSLFLSCFQK